MKNRSTSISILILLLVSSLIALQIFITKGIISNTPVINTATLQPTFTPTPISVPVSGSSEIILEVFTNPNISLKELFGTIAINFPSEILPSSSDTIYIEIEFPENYKELEGYPIEKRLPSNCKTSGQRKYIFISEHMRAELISPAFQIQPLFPASQSIYVSYPGISTTWGWIIKANEDVGLQKLILQVYMEDDLVPAWSCQFEVSIASPTPTFTPQPTSTPNPLPIKQQMMQTLSREITSVLLAFFTIFNTLIIAILNIYFQYIRRKNKSNKKTVTFKRNRSL